MKKLLLSAMFVAAMILCVSCGSEEYQKGSSIMKKTTKKVKKAENQRQLNKAMADYYDWVWDDPISETSESEDEKLEKQKKELLELYKTKEKELRNKSFDSDDDDDDDDWF